MFVSYKKKLFILIFVFFFCLKTQKLYIADTFFRNRRCPPWTGLTVIIIIIINIIIIIIINIYSGSIYKYNGSSPYKLKKIYK